MDQHFCLTWNNHQKNLASILSGFWMSQSFTDCMLACDGKCVKVHKVVLAACSSYFEEIMTMYGSDREPIIILRDIPYADLCAILEFMYYGEVRVSQNQLPSILNSADALRIKGLAEVVDQPDETPVRNLPFLSMSTAIKPKPTVDARSSMAPPLIKLQKVESLNSGDESDLEVIEEEYVCEEGLEGCVDSPDGIKPDALLTPTVDLQGEVGDGPAHDTEDPLEISLDWDEVAGEAVVDSGSSSSGSFDDVVKLDEYLRIPGNTRSQFWNEPFVHRVIAMISKNSVHLKHAANVLGVSYATAYAKYREFYGYRKHPHLGSATLGVRVSRAKPVVSGAPRKRRPINWSDPNIERVCSLISAHQITIKKGSDMLGIDYNTLYYHLFRNSSSKSSSRRKVIAQ